MLTVNGKPVLAMRLTLPVSGVWVASIEADAEEAITGAVTIKQSDSSASYAGYAVRSGELSGTCYLECIGGAGGLAGDVEARSYRDVTARTVVAEALAAAGEALASTSTRSVLDTALAFWTRSQGRVSQSLSAVADELGARWRVLPTGAVWFGAETWPDFRGEDIAELSRDPAAGTVLLAPDAIDLAPGVTLRGERIGRVEHLITRDDPLRTTAWIEAA